MKPIAYAKNPEYFHIPGFPRYGINHDGIVIDTENDDRIIPISLSSSGYKSCMLHKSEGGRTGVFIHRLVAMTFKFPEVTSEELKRLCVDHVDGNKLNNSVENLEWVSRKENCVRAGKMQLTIKSVPVILTHARTGKEWHFDTISDCASFLGVHKDTIRQRLARGPEHIGPGGYKIKRVYQTDDYGSQHNRRQNPFGDYSVAIRDVFEPEKEDMLFDTKTEAATFLEMGIAKFSRLFDLTLHPVWFGGYQLRYQRDDRPWRDCRYYDEIQKIRPRCVIPECYNTKTHELMRFDSIREAAKYFDTTENSIYYKCTTQGSRKFDDNFIWGTYPKLSNGNCPTMKQFVVDMPSNC